MGRPKLYANAVERVRAWRGRNSIRPYTVDLPVELIDQIEEWRRCKDRTRRQVFETLIRQQLLRKR